MNELQLIEELCEQIDRQNEIIKRLSMRLAQVSELTAEEERELQDARGALKNIIGDTLS